MLEYNVFFMRGRVGSTVFLMQLLDLVNVLTLHSKRIVVKHISIRQTSQLRPRKFCIRTEIKTINAHADDIQKIKSR